MDGQRIVMEKDRVHILRTIFIWRDTFYQRLGFRNYGDQPIDFRLTILFENDFADLYDDGMDEAGRTRARLQLKTLIYPEGMGERFQVLMQQKGVANLELTCLRAL